MEEITFTKMHGIGNDYIYIDCMHHQPSHIEELARAMSHRHTGVGGDGIVLICPSEVADFRMRIFNADGSEAKMCGNASRCIGKYVADRGMTDKNEITLETLSGIKTLYLNRDADDGTVKTVTVDMGEASMECRDIPVDSPESRFVECNLSPVTDAPATAVSMGNPHLVLFTDDLSTATVHSVGPELEHHPLFPDRVNVEFARVDAPDYITVRVWERGSGETQACGTGACAVTVAAQVTGRAVPPVTVELPGGCLTIDLRDDGHVMMTGPAEEVFTGIYRFRV